MGWKLAREYLRMHQILAFYLKTFPKYINCHFRKVLANEPKIGTQISWMDQILAFYLKTFPVSINYQSRIILFNETQFESKYFHCTKFYLKTFRENILRFFRTTVIFFLVIFNIFYILLNSKKIDYKICRWNKFIYNKFF